MNLQEKLAALEPSFSERTGLYGHSYAGPGYHSRVQDGTWVHGTRDNLYLAAELLESPHSHHQERAQDIMRRIIALQDLDPVSPTYGIWSWLVEEPLAQMNPPDWNWADFLGLTLAKILVVHGQNLDTEVKNLALQSLEHAAHSIFRRNVKADYTNIAVKGACVTAAAGELLEQPWLVRYGARRLQSVLQEVEQHGGFQEYNSPTYTRLVMTICETGLFIIKDAQVRAGVEGVWRKEWEFIAAHFHPGTRQLCGPQSRAYTDFLAPDWPEFLGSRTGLWPVADAAEPEALPCPPDLVPRLASLEQDMEERIQHTSRPMGKPVVGHVWMNPEACLGSIEDGTTWNQSRPLLGYWKVDEGQNAVVRLSMQHDGKDFASGYVWNTQRGQRVLTATGFIADGGDFHPHFDKSADGSFPVRELRLSYEVKTDTTGAQVSGEQLNENSWELSAGAGRAIIHIGASRLGNKNLTWELKLEPGRALLEGVAHFDAGEFNLLMLQDIRMVTGLELLMAAEDPSETGPQVSLAEAQLLNASWSGEWGNLELSAPTIAIPQAQGGMFGGTAPRRAK